MASFRSALLALALAASAAASAQGDPQTVARIIDEGKNHSQVMNILKSICYNIGPRLTGSPELSNGQKWALAEFRKMGLSNVHLGQWGEVPVGFDRGPLQVARMVEPFESEMSFTTPDWTNGTHGLVRADAVMCPETPELAEANKDQLKGKWVVLTGSPYRPNAKMMEVLDKLPIAGVVVGSRNELVQTFGSWKGKTFENHPGVPQFQVRKSDFDRITRNLSFGRKVVLEMGAENRWYKGPIKQYNVVADLPGTEKPDELVIVSGHFDSWNGPGSQGALDNGTGTTTAMEAARILTAVHAKPKRTIRFILWSGEEQGLYGSENYVKLHPEELPKTSAVLVDDGGTGYQAGYVGLESQREIMEAAFAPMNVAFPDLPEKFEVRPHMPKGGGSDHASYNAVGVPGFFTMEGGTVDYGHVHHTQFDRYEEAVPKYLVQSGTNHAVVAYNLACLPTLLPRDAPAATK